MHRYRAPDRHQYELAHLSHLGVDLDGRVAVCCGRPSHSPHTDALGQDLSQRSQRNPVLTVANEASNDPPFLLPLESLSSPFAENAPITHSPATHYVNANKYKYDPSELITWSRRVGGPQDGGHWVSCIHEALSGACCKQRSRCPPFLGCKSPPASGTQECGHLIDLCTCCCPVVPR